MTSDVKAIFSIIALGVAFIGLVPYIVNILRRKTKPHCFSWCVWSLLTAIAFCGQRADHGGAGAWVTGINSATCFVIFFLSLHYGEKKITRSDWISFACALLAIPLWLVTKTPLYSMILVTLIDGLGFYPTFRKSWFKPYEETISSFALAGIMYGFGVLALEHYSVITVLYPASLFISNLGFVFYVLVRRRELRHVA